MDFTDKRVLVTGSSRGIGFEIAASGGQLWRLTADQLQAAEGTSRMSPSLTGMAVDGKSLGRP